MMQHYAVQTSYDPTAFASYYTVRLRSFHAVLTSGDLIILSCEFEPSGFLRIV